MAISRRGIGCDNKIPTAVIVAVQVNAYGDGDAKDVHGDKRRRQ